MSVEERYKDVVKFKPKCTYCETENDIEEIIRLEDGSYESCFICSNQECKRIMSMKYLVNKLTAAIQEQLRRYLDQNVICDEPTCQTKTRMIGVYGRKCLQSNCRGVVSLEVTLL